MEFTLYFTFCDVAFKFEDLPPTAEDTEDKITNFLALSESIRSFRFELPSLQENSFTTAPVCERARRIQPNNTDRINVIQPYIQVQDARNRFNSVYMVAG